MVLTTARKVVGVVLLALCSGRMLALPQETAGIRVRVSEIKRANPGEFELRFRISNVASVPIFLQTERPMSPVAIYTLRLEQQRPDGRWQALPRHLEHRPLSSHPLILQPAGEYDVLWKLRDPYVLSKWVAGVSHESEIPLRGNLRFAVNYFLGEKEWADFVALDKASESRTPREEMDFAVRASRQAYSMSFQLPPVQTVDKK